MTDTKQCPCGATHEGESGGYYTSAIDGDQYGLLAGPFDSHAQALSWVDRTRAKAEEVNSRAVFFGFGTLRAKDDYRKPGRLNKLLGIGESVVQNNT